MSNAVALFDKFTVVDTSQLPKSAASSLLDNTNSNFRRISIKGGVFRYMVGGKEVGVSEDRYLDVVFVNAAPKYSRTYYTGAYEEGANSAPVCWSADGVSPASDCKTPQHSSCTTCPQNIKGSGNQGDSRACRYSQRIAVVLANDIGGEVFSLTLPATSIWGDATAKGYPLSGYSEQLKARGIDPGHIVTRMAFDINSATPKLIFAPQRFLNTDEAMTAIKQGATDDAKAAITMTVAQIDKVEERPQAPAHNTAPVKREAIPITTETPVKVEAIPPQAKEPAVRKTQENVPPKADLSALVAQWGADD
jgi:hypothetical protein